MEEEHDLGEEHSPLPWHEDLDGHLRDAYKNYVVFFGRGDMPDNYMENRAFILQCVNRDVRLEVVKPCP